MRTIKIKACIILLFTFTVFAQSTDNKSLSDYFNESILNQESFKLYIPLKGKPQPLSDDIAFVADDLYTDPALADFFKKSIQDELNEINNHLPHGEILHIKLNFEEEVNKRFSFYGHAMCQASLELGIKPVSASILATRDLSPFYIDPSTPDFLKKSLPKTASQYQIDLLHMPDKVCRDIVNNWNKCEQIIIEAIPSSYSERDFEHGFEEIRGASTHHSLNLSYINHSVICKS